MQVSIAPSEIKGEIFAPASKSSMQRACAASLVRKAESIIHNPGTSNDDKAALRVIQALGATVEYLPDGSIKINSEGFLRQSSSDGLSVNCGESGLGIRMFAPIIALNSNKITINGEGSLLTRPMDFFDEVLPQLGVQITSNNGKLPLVLKGPLQPKDITIDGSLSSQFLTGLLLSYAAAGASGVSIKVIDLKSKPYVDLTLKVMNDFGLQVPENKNYEEFYFGNRESSIVKEGTSEVNLKPSVEDHERTILNEELSIGNRDTVIVNQSAIPESAIIEYTVEGDWSGGAFLLVAGAIAGDITVKGLDINSTQADKAILQALKDCGCALNIGQGVINVGPGELTPFSFDATDCPDLFPPLVALAAYCSGTTVIKGVQRLTHKESNRALTLQDEFGKLGIEIQLQGDEMLVIGGSGVKAANVHSRHDHRIAMACAVAALKANGNVVIEEAQAVNKSYPDFYTHIGRLGAVVKITENETTHI